MARAGSNALASISAAAVLGMHDSYGPARHDWFVACGAGRGGTGRRGVAGRSNEPAGFRGGTALGVDAPRVRWMRGEHGRHRGRCARGPPALDRPREAPASRQQHPEWRQEGTDGGWK